MSKCQLIQGDCLEEMDKLIDDGVKVDLVLTDPPYGTTACKWDNVIPFEPMWECFNGLSKERTPVVLFGSEPFSSHLRLSNIEHYRYDWKWNKKKPSSPLIAKIQPLRIMEDIMVFYKKSKQYYPVMRKGKPRVDKKSLQPNGEAYGGKIIERGYNNPNGLYFPVNLLSISNANQNNKLHPTQKPVELLEYLIKTYTNEEDLVLDCCMGSGSTGVACLQTNRNFIGIELDEKYYEIAKMRCKDYQSKLW